MPRRGPALLRFPGRGRPAAARGRGDLQIMFGVGGERDLTERELPHLRGWRGSRPVRIGNGAWTQRQLDVYGELLGAVHRLREQVGALAPATAGFLTAVADTALRRWRQPDHGIWEIRDEPRHFVHSKLSAGSRSTARSSWPARSAPTRPRQAAGSGTGRDPAGDPRAGLERPRRRVHPDVRRGRARRIDAVAADRGLPARGGPQGPRDGARDRRAAHRPAGLVYRYRSDDGLEGKEGSFLLCTFWLAHALALGGEVERARETFEPRRGLRQRPRPARGGGRRRNPASCWATFLRRSATSGW